MKRGLIFVLLLILLTSISFSLVNSQEGESYEVADTYGPGEDLQGWIKIEFDNEPVTSIFEDSEDNQINIIDLLKSDTSLVEGVDYTCSVPGCEMTYTGVNGESSKTLSIDEGESKIVGFKFTGTSIDITSVSFDISSDAAPSCENQLEIDFFADVEVDYGNDNPIAGDCSAETKTYGCFDPTETSELVLMDGNGKMYCQRIRLSESPGFKIGAWLKVSSGAKVTKIGIYDLNLDIVNYKGSDVECELGDLETTGTEKKCEVDFLVTESEDYYVCVYNEEGPDDKTQKSVDN